MKIKSSTQIESLNDRFNHFHDGFLRRIALTRDTEFIDVSPVCGPEELEEFWSGMIVEFDLRHSNYDYPNQPENRLVKIRALACVDLVENIERFLGKSIFDLRFASHLKGIECLLTYHADGEVVRSVENGVQVSLFVAESIEIEETSLN